MTERNSLVILHHRMFWTDTVICRVICWGNVLAVVETNLMNNYVTNSLLLHLTQETLRDVTFHSISVRTVLPCSIVNNTSTMNWHWIFLPNFQSVQLHRVNLMWVCLCVGLIFFSCFLACYKNNSEARILFQGSLIWNLVQTSCHWDRFCSEHFGFHCQLSFHQWSIVILLPFRMRKGVIIGAVSQGHILSQWRESYVLIR
jgi:hypothetical protein